jgi:hypothetical protein
MIQAECIGVRAIWKATSGELLAKQAMGKKKLLYTKNTYMLKLFLDIATARN